MVNTFLNYQLISRDIGRSLKQVQSQPVVERESKYYLDNIEKVKSIDDFVGDDRLFNYAMKAFGLSDMAYAKAFMVKVLEGGIDKRDSFANSLSDKRYREFAATFDFAHYGDAATLFQRAGQGTVDKYVRQTLEENAGQQDEGVRLALYFQRKAANITSPFDILADPALSSVIRTTFGWPNTIAQANIDKQADMISSRIDMADFQDPEKVTEFLQRFTTMWDFSNSSTSSPTSIAALMAQPVELGVSTDLLLTLARLKG